MLAAALQKAAPAGKWWPYDDLFMVIVSAVLTQQTRWDSVERSMEALAREGWLTPHALAKADPLRVEQLLRPTGFFRQKARAVDVDKICVRAPGQLLDRARQRADLETKAPEITNGFITRRIRTTANGFNRHTKFSKL